MPPDTYHKGTRGAYRQWAGRIAVFFSMVAFTAIGGAVYAAQSISKDKVDPTKIYWGASNSASFDKPGAVEWAELLKATPEYDEIRKKKIEQGTARYWILRKDAEDRVNVAIDEVAKVGSYDLIAESSYLSSLDPAINAEDITKQVTEAIE